MNQEQTVALSPSAAALAEMIVEHQGQLALDPPLLLPWCTKTKDLSGAEASALATEVLSLSIKTRRLAGSNGNSLVGALEAIADALMIQSVRPLGAAPDMDAPKTLSRWTGAAPMPRSAPLEGSEAPKGTFTVGSVAANIRELPRRPRPKVR
jgi:hypothetical protein